ncbi:hypothetical protein CVIRNUC_009638 [Coccomyxa viridis]|uniref:Uncharacterized protein n=1 Tax=Coccomyxa viridis TaxID=1274662 RepID=A0AAV1IK66_9CHLO|nr:hypothetical protein CVIRNUC_009638 [Coccomyxa viridis]
MGSAESQELQRGSQFCSGNGQTKSCWTKGALNSILLPRTQSLLVVIFHLLILGSSLCNDSQNLNTKFGAVSLPAAESCMVESLIVLSREPFPGICCHLPEGSSLATR